MRETAAPRLAAARGRVAAAALLLAVALAASMVPAQAFAYFDRGSVSVALGTQQVQVQAGETASVTVGITPASDDQTEGCGMPTCPQGCASTCTDENGQCRCAGTDYATYYPTAVATSSNASVAVATYEGGALTVYGKQAGEATITVRASLRQFTDAEATLTVQVSGQASGAQAGSAEFVDVPEQAQAEQADKADVVEKTIMKRPVHMVRINEQCDAPAALAALAGIDGDVTFWEGDTYYQPDYSLTFKGTNYTADAVPAALDPSLAVSTEADGALNQPLAGLDGYLVVDFAQKGALPAQAKVFAQAKGVFADDAQLSLFSYDEAAKAFVREDAPAQMVGGYASFDVAEGKTYVVSTRDLTIEANAAVTGGSQQAGNADGANASAQPQATTLLPAWLPIAAVAVLVIAAVAIALIVRRRRGARSQEGR